MEATAWTVIGSAFRDSDRDRRVVPEPARAHQTFEQTFKARPRAITGKRVA
jgi:hypothetical protein